MNEVYESLHLQTGSLTLWGPVDLLGLPGPASLTASTLNSHSLPSTRAGTVKEVPETGLELTGLQSPLPFAGHFSMM